VSDRCGSVLQYGRNASYPGGYGHCCRSLKIFQEALTGRDLLIDEVRRFAPDRLFTQVELYQKEDTDIVVSRQAGLARQKGFPGNG